MILFLGNDVIRLKLKKLVLKFQLMCNNISPISTVTLPCKLNNVPAPMWFKNWIQMLSNRWAYELSKKLLKLLQNTLGTQYPPVLATYNMLPTEKKSRFVQVWQEWSKGKRLQIGKTHQLQEIHKCFFIRSNAHRLRKQILTSSMFGLTEFQAPATIKFRSVRWSQTCMHR